MSKPTPGPWAVDLYESGGFEIEAHGQGVRGGTLVLASRMGHPDRRAEMHANGRLIAAAPLLFAELRHLVSLLEPLERRRLLDVPGLATLNGARAALKAATGN